MFITNFQIVTKRSEVDFLRKQLKDLNLDSEKFAMRLMPFAPRSMSTWMTIRFVSPQIEGALFTTVLQKIMDANIL